MDATSTRLLDAFAGHAHRDALDPADWGLFYEVIIDAFERDVSINPKEIQTSLEKAGLPAQMARDLAAFYDRARGLLEHHDDRTL